MSRERLQKFLSRAGIASRRHAEELIAAGQVRINGTRATVGMSVDAAVDAVTVRGKPVTVPSALTYLLLHKPRGIVTTRSDERGRRTVSHLLPPELRLRVWPVGRLDADSEGLVLCTDDGALTQRLTHPKYEVEKEYVVVPKERPTAAQLAALRHGATVAGGRRVRPTRIRMEEGTIHVTIREGAKHEVRSLARSAGIIVTQLIRVRMGTLTLPDDLAPGQYRPLTAAERDALGVAP